MMHRILIIITFILFPIELFSQTGKRFEYINMGSSYLVTPIFDQTKPDGKQGRPIWTDDLYINKLFTNPIDEVLSKETRDSLHLSTTVLITFNSGGDILNCKFFISKKDSTLISEDDLFNLHDKYKKIKIDTSKIKIVPDYNTEWKEADYAVITAFLISKESREKFNREREERILKKKQQKFSTP
jgi:hypothetical protein